MANIKDVAQRSGVSITTVSHVVNGTRFVSEIARLRVEEAVRELGYVPSAVARSLKNNNTRTFGMVIPNNSNPYFAEIIRGVEDRCFAAGYNVILCNSNDDPKRQASYFRVLAEKRVDGLVFVATGSDAVVRATLGGIATPMVFLDREVAGMSNGDLVEVNHTLGGEIATRHLLELGHPGVACISGPPGLSPSSKRRAGWKNALESAAVERRESDLARGDFTARGGYQAMQTLLRHKRPSAVFVCNDLMAFGALAAAREAGISVPQQLSVVGFDDIDLAAFSAPPLTTVVQPKLLIGTLAAELLLERVNSNRRDARHVILDPQLKLRGSTASYQSIRAKR